MEKKTAGARPAVITRDFVLATTVNFTIATVFYLLLTTMALYAVTSFGANDSVAGLASSAYVIGAVVSRLFIAKYLDFVGRRRTLIISMVAFALGSLLYLLATDVTSLIALRFVHGLAFGSASTAVSVIAVALVPTARRGEGMSYYSMAGTLAIGVGPLLGTVLIDNIGFEPVFWAGAGAAFIGLLVALMLRTPERTPSDHERATLRRIRFDDMIDKDALRISAVIFLACFAYSGVASFYLNYADATGTTTAAGVFFAVYSVAVLVSRLVAGRVQDRFGDNAVFMPSLVAFFAGLVLISFPPSQPLAIACAVVLAFGFGTIMPGGHAIAVSSVAPARMGVATSTFYVAADASIGIGPVLLGLLIPLIGFQGMYLGLAGAILLTLLAYWFLHGHKRADAASRIPAV